MTAQIHVGDRLSNERSPTLVSVWQKRVAGLESGPCYAMLGLPRSDGRRPEVLERASS